MRIRLPILSIAVIFLVSCAGNQISKKIDESVTGYPITPVSFTEVKVTDGFWAPRIEINRTVTIPFAMKKNEETDRGDSRMSVWMKRTNL